MTQTKIVRLGHQGDGISDDGIFAPRTLPDEVISGEVVDGRIAAPKIVETSDARIKPKCPVYNQCGGCDLLHVSDQFVHDWKIDVVQRALTAQGLPSKIEILHTSPENSRRRAKMAGTRTKSGAIVGFRGRGAAAIVDASRCKVLSPAIIALIPGLEILTTHLASRKGVLEFWILSTDTGIDLAVEGGKALDINDLQKLALWANEHGLARLSVNGEQIATLVTPVLTFGQVAVTIPPKAFSQATQAGEVALQKGVAKALEGSQHIIDLFSGSGTLGLPLANHAEVHAVEGIKEPLDALQLAVNHSKGLKKVSIELRDLAKNPIMAEDLVDFDGAIIDPPRAGAIAQIEHLAESEIANVAMVSCNPVTFARDAKILCDAGYKINWVELVDQFRWSPHIEIVAKFSK